MTNNVNSIVQIVIDVLMQTILTRIQQMINVNSRQKLFKFSNSSKFVDVVDVVDIDEIDKIAFDNEQRFVIIRTIDNIEYFDSTYENEKNNSIVNVDRYIYYRDVFIFVDRLKNLKKKFVDVRVREFVVFYLRNETLI